MTDKEQKRKKLVRTLIYVFAATVVLLVVVRQAVGHVGADGRGL